MGTLTDNKHHNPNSDSFSFEQKLRSVSAQFNKLFGREKRVRHLAGAANLLMCSYRGKKDISKCLRCSTVWVLFEWQNCIFFLPIVALVWLLVSLVTPIEQVPALYCLV